MFSIISFFFYPKAGAQTFTTSGSWTVPAGTTRATFEAWGGGGAGQGVTSNLKYGAGGGGGGYAIATISVSAGQVYNVTVGSGGSVNCSGGVCTPVSAGDSYVTNPSSTTVVLAKAGNYPSGSCGSPCVFPGGTGGSSASETGDVKYSGGTGGVGDSSNLFAGGGGGGAGSTGNGGNASGTTAGTGTSTNGGNGGAGLTSRGAGNAGSIYGGGGGGGLTTSNSTQNGGAGAQGLVIITPITNSAPSTPNLSIPSSGATGVSTSPQFQLSSTDADSDYIEYRIYLYQSDCSAAISGSPYTETSSQTGWSGQDANSGLAYASGTTATYTYQGSLNPNTTYCWKADAIDPGGSNTYSSASATQTFTTGQYTIIRQEINILDNLIAANSTSSEIVMLDTTKYSGNVSYYFEVDSSNGVTTSDTATLTRSGTTTNDASVVLTTGSATRFRSAAFTPPSGQTEYVVKSGASNGLSMARIVIIQSSTSASITSTETQVEVGNWTAIDTTTTANSAVPNPVFWAYNSADWDGTQSYYAEVTKSQTATNFNTTAVLQEDDGSFANWTNIATIMSPTVNATCSTASAATRCRSASFTPTNGRHYRLGAWESASTGSKQFTLYNGKIIVDQTSATSITKFEPTYHIASTGSGNAIGPNHWDPTEWSGVNNSYYYELSCTSATCSSSVSGISGSSISGTNEVISGSLTMPGSASDMSLGTSSTGNGYRVIVVSTIIAGSAPTTDQQMRGGTYFSNGSKQPIYWAQ